MRKIFLITSFLVFGLMGSASANLINGDFETGDLTGWTSSGDVQVIDFNDGSLVGDIADFVANVQGMDDHFALFGAGSTSGESALSQEFGLSGAKEVTIAFDYAFDSFDWSWSQDTFVSIASTQGTTAVNVKMVDLSSNGQFLGVGFQSGHFEHTYDLTNLGLTGADMSFVLTEASTKGTFSLAGLDNVSVTTAPVPEPSTVLLMGLGLAGLVGYNRKRSNKKS